MDPKVLVYLPVVCPLPVMLLAALTAPLAALQQYLRTHGTWRDAGRVWVMFVAAMEALAIGLSLILTDLLVHIDTQSGTLHQESPGFAFFVFMGTGLMVGGFGLSMFWLHWVYVPRARGESRRRE